ncbi:hypothetical protein ScPMuIL_016700, partial [Solemya velum]
MAKIVECVPNFSEGRDKKVIEAIGNAIASTDGCSLLDVDPGASTNRTVYTFVGSPERIINGALNAAREAFQLLDMRKHQGEHPRLGAMDVCPFIPVQNVTMEDCVKIAKEFAEKLAVELSIAVYLYGEASEKQYRKSVPQIRAGEYEGLAEKIVKPEWKPDFGLAKFIPTWGASMVGARKFLIAYNINLLATKEQAHRIALNIREQGRGQDQPGRLKGVQAIGWYLEEANLAQVSINIADYEITPIYQVFEEVVKDSEELNLPVVGSQIVGLIPKKALMDMAEYYIKKSNLFILEEDQKLRLVINKLGLNSLGLFNPKERIVEYMIQEEQEEPLVNMNLKDFILTVASRSPSPGGGSVAALSASLGTALTSMVGFLSYGNRKFYHVDSRVRKLIPPLYGAMKELMTFIDADAAAFSEYMFAMKMPRSSEEEIFLRDKAMQESLLTAIQVPLTVSRIVNTLWPFIKELVQIGNLNCKADLQVGVRTLETAVWGAYYNILTNLNEIKEEEMTTR